MNERIRIVAETPLSEGFVSLTRFTFDYRRSDGEVQRLEREVHHHGHVASILPYDPVRGTVLLVRQFRLPVQLCGEDGMLIEAIAGLLDGDAPEVCSAREAEEEAGVRVRNLRHAFTAFSSPGCITERTDFFLADYDLDARVHGGGGLHHEGEDIEVVELPFEEALAMIGRGEIRDVKAILLLQHLALGRAGQAS